MASYGAIGSPSPKRTANDAARAVKDSAVKDSGKTIRVSETARKAPPEAESRKPKTTRRRKRTEGDWEYLEDEKLYHLEPQKQEVHKYTWIYLHYLCGHPKEYFTVEGFQTPGLRVVLPKAPVFRSLHYGEGAKGSKSRLWYDYYHDPDDPKEDPKEGADAEELELDSDEEKEARKAAGLEVREEDEEEEDDEEMQENEPGDAEAAAQKPQKFAEWIKTISPNTHPEINIPKEAQVEKSVNRVLKVIHKEAARLGGDYSRIFLGGWSQGATVALLAAIHKDCPSLGGVLATTGTFHTKRVADAATGSVKTTPFVLYVGVKDDTYPVMLLNPMVEKLRSIGYQIELREKNMDHNLNGNIGPAYKVEERWMKQYIEAMYQESSLGALMKANSAVAPLDAKESEAAVKIVYGLLFGNKMPHNRRAEIMKYSCTEGPIADIAKHIKKLSADELTLVARFFGAESCTAAELLPLLATPNATAMAALRAGVAPMDFD
jgi:predicted esterase